MKTYEDGLREALAICRAVEKSAITVGALEELAAEEAAGKCGDEIEKLLPQPKPVEQATVLEPEPGGFVARAVAATDAGIEMFGDYTFHDKGPREVMNLRAFTKELAGLPGDQAGCLLEALAKQGANYKIVAGAMLCSLDGQPSKWWDACCENAPSVEY